MHDKLYNAFKGILERMYPDAPGASELVARLLVSEVAHIELLDALEKAREGSCPGKDT